jgi:Protein of unknown function (DUF2934)
MTLLAPLEADPFVEIAEQAGHAAGVARERIARLAFEKWCRRGRQEGTAEQDWLEAERELQPSDPPYVEALARAEWLAHEIDNCPDAE